MYSFILWLTFTIGSLPQLIQIKTLTFTGIFTTAVINNFLTL